MISRFSVLIVALISAAAAWSAPLTVRVVDPSGKPVANAVVFLKGPGAPLWRPAGARFVVAQRNLQFQPFVLLVPVGAVVSFPNADNTRHQVYSFSSPKPFELKLFARDQSRSVIFDKPGVVALGCNIHDNMSAFVVVAESGWAAKTDAQGRATFASTPANGVMTVWHPYLRSPGNQLTQAVPHGSVATITARLRPASMHPTDY
jgi:plastocyanin